MDKEKWYQPSGKAIYTQAGWQSIYEYNPRKVKKDSCLYRVIFYLIAIGLIAGSILLLSLDNSINLLMR